MITAEPTLSRLPALPGGKSSIYEVVENLKDTLTFLGTAITKSQLYGCSTIEQGIILAWQCYAKKCPPFDIAERNHLICNKLSQKAHFKLAGFHAIGGKHEIVERTADCAEIRLKISGETHTERLTWEEAQKENWPYEKDKKTLKYNWSTPRSRRQMLWARVISEAVSTLRPGINLGGYTPEEIIDFAGPVPRAVIDQMVSEGESHSQQNGQVESLPPATIQGEVESTAVAQPAAIEKPKKSAAKKQAAKVDEAKSVESPVAAVVESPPATEKAPAPSTLAEEPGVEGDPAAKATQAQRDRVCAAIAAAEQLPTNAKRKFADLLAGKLAAHGMRKLTDLCNREITALYLELEKTGDCIAWLSRKIDLPF